MQLTLFVTRWGTRRVTATLAVFCISRFETTRPTSCSSGIFPVYWQHLIKAENKRSLGLSDDGRRARTKRERHTGSYSKGVARESTHPAPTPEHRETTPEHRTRPLQAQSGQGLSHGVRWQDSRAQITLASSRPAGMGASTKRMLTELTQWRSLVGVMCSPSNTWPRCPSQAAQVISMRRMP
jgi:hypothetical protein